MCASTNGKKAASVGFAGEVRLWHLADELNNDQNREWKDEGYIGMDINFFVTITPKQIVLTAVKQSKTQNYPEKSGQSRFLMMDGILLARPLTEELVSGIRIPSAEIRYRSMRPRPVLVSV